MEKFTLDTYCKDISTILQYANKDNLEVVTQAVTIISKYAHILSQEVETPVNDEAVVKALTKSLKKISQEAESTPVSADDMQQLKQAMQGHERASLKPQPEPDNTYRVDRKLIGALIGDQYYSESIIRKLGLNNGDLVKLTPPEEIAGTKHYLPQIELISANETEAPEEPIIRETVLVESDSTNGLVARYRYNHERLLVNGEPATIRLNLTDTTNHNVQPGDVVDIAYYRNSDGNEARVSWVYNADKSKSVPERPTVKPHSAYIKRESSAPRHFTPNMHYDLNNQIVLMAGYGAHKELAEEVIKAHNGRLTVYDGKASGKGIEGDLTTAIRHADIVIIMLHSVSHNTANHAISIAKDFDKFIAATNTNSPLAIEEAIDRALKREPVYQSSSHVVE